MHFIVTTDATKADRITRKLIRSQVMIGKNRGKSHRDKAQRRKAADSLPEGDSEPAATLWYRSADEALSVSVPAIVGGSSLSMVQFATSLDAPAVRDVLSFYDLATRALFPLRMVTNFSKRDLAWLDPMMVDAAYVHVTVFAAETVMDRMLGRHYAIANPDAMAHCLKGVNLLRHRLAQPDEQFSDCTIAVVLTLALSALFLGDHASLRQHMLGLHKMVALRGGVKAFRGSKLITEILRCDLGMVIQGGGRPVFFNDPHLEPILPYPDRALSRAQRSMGISRRHGNKGFPFPDADERLQIAWRYMDNFCLVVNHAVTAHQKLSPTMLSETMAAVMYRLLNVAFRPASLDEVVRLALLGLTYHIFSQWQHLRLPYAYIPPLYEACLRDPVLAKKTAASDPGLVLWLLMVGAVSVFSPVAEYPWLKIRVRQQLNNCVIKSWEEVTELFKSYLWIGMLHDKAGKDIFDAVFACPDTVSCEG